MIQGAEINRLVDLLTRRGASLFHACQYIDFCSYVKVGGIPSRRLLKERGYPFTTFETDQMDDENGVWDKVFFNLSDFGRMFANPGKTVVPRAVPTVYGPIQLRVRPEALSTVDDVAVCIKSAGFFGYNREAQALKSVEEVDRLFRYPLSSGGGLSEIKWISELQDLYPNIPRVANPEINCSSGMEYVSLNYVDRIIVDPYVLAGRTLKEYVKEVVPGRWQVNIGERAVSANRKRLYQEIATLLVAGIPTLQSIQRGSSLDADLRQWASNLDSLEYNFKNFVRYLREGTLEPLLLIS